MIRKQISISAILIAIVFVAAHYMSRDNAPAGPETLPAGAESSGCAGGSISFTPQEDGTIVVTCPEGRG
jgi:hypothetical protein